MSSDIGRVILWTRPRCCSTVFERSIRELPSVKCLHEPHLLPFYKSYEKIEGVDPKYWTYEFIEQSLLANYEGYDYLFAKEMAAFVPSEMFPKFTEGSFADFKHTFLIRKPQKSVPSRWKACVRSDIDFSVHEDAFSYSKLFDLFELICSTGRDVVVLDADDLLKNPEYMMEQYCCLTGLPYDKKMLTWTPGEVKDWTVFKFYKEWYGNAMYSSGFRIPASASRDDHLSTEKIPDVVEEKIPDFVEKIIEESIPFYEAMHKYRIKLP